MKRVVVTGLGALTPIGNNVQEYTQGLKNGVSGADRITLFDPTLFKTQFACEVKNFQPEDYMEKREVRRVDLPEQNGGLFDTGSVEVARYAREFLDR